MDGVVVLSCWLPRDEFVRRVVAYQADAAFRAELRQLAPDTTDDQPLT